MPVRLLSAAIAVALFAPALVAAQALQPPHDRERGTPLEQLVVTASPLRPLADEIARPVEVLAGAQLDAVKANTLGETLEGLPGVHSSWYGPGVGRPVIRGQDGPRVQVLASGLSVMDVSAGGADHAVSVEPFLADQIEVLKGPATLLYGSGAIGGAINVVDGRIPEIMPERAVSGRAELRGNTVNNERTGLVRLDGGAGAVAWHVDLLRRRTDDYKLPGHADDHDEDHDDGHDDDSRLENSSVSTDNAAFGLSWIGTRGYLGASFTRYDTDYGVPGHAHGDGDDHDDDEDEEVRIDLKQRRVDVRGRLDDPFAGHGALRFSLARSEYQHIELEDGDVGTVFENDGIEGRIEALHHQIGHWTGAYGVQWGRRDFASFGEEAFVPSTLSRDLGVFLIENASFGPLALELGARADRVRHSPEDDALDRRRFSTLSLSAASRWHINDDIHLRFGLDRAERAPSTEELYSDGPHIATRAYEVGDVGLDTEVANRAELGLHWHSPRVHARGAVYRTHFDDFIYLADTGEEEDDLPLREWSQANARFTGAEAEVRVLLTDGGVGAWHLRTHGDWVRARLTDGSNLPRIPAARFGTALEWRHTSWRASLGAVRYGSQERVAEFEEETHGYTLVNAHLSYHWDVRDVGWELFLDGRNLTNRLAIPHTSYLRDVPLPGRGLAFGVRAFF
jgi:iron complex outermembrane recepter protein